MLESDTADHQLTTMVASEAQSWQSGPVALSAEPEPTVTSLVENIGFGRGQLMLLVLAAGGANFCGGLAQVLADHLAQSMVDDLSLDRGNRRLLEVTANSGWCLGLLSGGFFGSALGRRATTIWAYVLIAVASFATSVCNSFWTVKFGRSAMCFFVGCATAPSAVLLLENTPQAWRLLMVAAMQTAFYLGAATMALIEAIEDETLQQVDWRANLIILAIPPAILAIASLAWLPESPVYLAFTGNADAAREAFTLLLKANPNSGIRGTRTLTDRGELRYRLPSRPAAYGPPDLKIVCSILTQRKYLSTTIVCAYLSFCLNVAFGAGLEHAPRAQLLTTIPVGKAAVIRHIFLAALSMFVALPICWCLTRRNALKYGTIHLVLSLLAFAWAATADGLRKPWQDVLCCFGFTYWVAVTTQTIIFVLTAELYPAIASAMGIALIMGAGRLGELLVDPFLDIGDAIKAGAYHASPGFLYTLAAFSAVGLPLCLLLPELKPFTTGIEPAA